MNECECGADQRPLEYKVDGKHMRWEQLKHLLFPPKKIEVIAPEHALTCPAIRNLYQSEEIRHNIFVENE